MAGRCVGGASISVSYNVQQSAEKVRGQRCINATKEIRSRERVKRTTTFQPRTRRSKRHSHICIPKAIKIRIPSRLNNLSGIPQRNRNRIPLLPRIVIRGARRIEQPIPFVANKGLDFLDDFTIGLGAHANDIRVLWVRDNDLYEGSAKRGVEHGA